MAEESLEGKGVDGISDSIAGKGIVTSEVECGGKEAGHIGRCSTWRSSGTI